MVYVANAKTGFCSRACVHAVRCSLFYPQAPLFPLTFTLKPCSEISLLNSPTLNHLGLFWNFFLCWNYGAWFALSWMRSLKDCRSSLDAGEDGRSCLCSSLLLLLLNQIPCSFCREQRCNRCVAAPTPHPQLWYQALTTPAWRPRCSTYAIKADLQKKSKCPFLDCVCGLDLPKPNKHVKASWYVREYPMQVRIWMPCSCYPLLAMNN